MTTGTWASNRSTASTASSCAATTTTPSTPWDRKCSRARCSSSPSHRATVATLTNQPASRAAPSTAMSVLVGPNSAEPDVTTPIVLVRRVTSARAAVFRR